MNKKLQFFVVVIILLIFGLSCSYASNQTDDTGSDAISTDVPKTDNIITKTTESDVKEATSEVTNYASLSKELLDNSGVDKTVNMKKGTYTITNPIKMTQKAKTIVVNGNGAVIDGSNAKSFLTVTANNKLTINNLVIKNTKNTNEAAGIIVSDKAQLTLNNCTFINNVASGKGGALLNRGTTVVNGCEFNSNTAAQGGAIWSTGDYAGSIVIKNSKFIKNKASNTNNYDKTGVIYFVSGKNSIESNTFEANVGRSIHNFKSTLSVSKNTFKNTVLNAAGTTIRGAVIDNYEAPITITDNIFNNITVSARDIRGGILYNEIGKSSFNNNKVTNFKVTTSRKDNDDLNGGLIFNRNSTLTVSENEFTNTNNGNKIHGGVLYNNMGTLNVTNNIFKTSDTASKEIQGGAIYNDDKGTLYYGGNNFQDIKTSSGLVMNKTIYNKGFMKEIKVPVTPKSTVVTVKDVHGVVGNNILLIANVNDVSDNKVTGGTLVFKINGKTVSNKISVKNGLATAVIVATKSYNKGNLSASYGGTTGFKANSTAKNGIVSLSLRNAKVTVTASPSSAKQYETIVFTAKVVDSATGKAISDNSKAVAVFKINGKSIKNSLNNVIKFQIKNGVATFNYAVPKGMAGYTVNGSVRYYDVTACVSHPDYNTIDRATTKFTVQRSNISLTTTTLVANMTSKKLTIKANVKDYKGNNVLGTTKLNIKINGKTVPINNVTTTTFNNGVIDLVMDLPQVSSLNSIMFVIGERCSYESLRETITDITKVK